MSTNLPYRVADVFFPSTGKRDKLLISTEVMSYRITQFTLQLYDQTLKKYSTIGLIDGMFTVIEGADRNIQIEDSCLLLLDISNELYYPIGWFNKSLTTFEGRGQNYRKDVNAFLLIDVSDSQFYEIVLDDGAFGIVY